MSKCQQLKNIKEQNEPKKVINIFPPNISLHSETENIFADNKYVTFVNTNIALFLFTVHTIVGYDLSLFHCVGYINTVQIVQYPGVVA